MPGTVSVLDIPDMPGTVSVLGKLGMEPAPDTA